MGGGFDARYQEHASIIVVAQEPIRASISGNSRNMVGDAYKFIVPILGAAAVSALVRFPFPALFLAAIAAFMAYFFRNPHREVPAGDNLVVSPADGKVLQILPLTEPDGEAAGHSISIFLSIFDVHVNRAPIRGKLKALEYRRGKFKAAFDDEASRVNEQNVLTIQGEQMLVVVKQIAGLIARRVICWKKPGHSLERGEPIGLIRFGSRVEIVVPKQVRLRVKVGDRVKGGSSILGEYL